MHHRKGGDYVARKFKRNICRKRKRRVSDKQKLDLHHICYQKRFWRRNSKANELREFHYCKVYIPRDTLHKSIHAKVVTIPVPRSSSAECALSQLQMLERNGAIHANDPLERRLLILAALFDCIEQPTADAFRKQLALVHEFNNKKAPQ